MALTPEEQAQLDALTAKANATDNDDDFDVEIWDKEGNGARVPYRKGKTWLQKFGIDLPEPEGETEDPPKPASRPKGKTTQDGNVTHAAKYFGNKNAG
jgi:hypothetical protein